MKKIDIIIPAYKAQDTIIKTLGSIIMQTIKDDIKVTICNDADDTGYKDIVDYFSKYLDIKEIILPKNGGPGVARQYGIDNTSLPYITFIDADDTFQGPYALELLFEPFTYPQYATNSMVAAKFEEATYAPNLMFIDRKKRFIWMFAKLYKRSFLDKYGIRFNETRANEDNGFNTFAQLCITEEKEKPIFIEHNVYCWNYRKDSITRINENEYTCKDNIVGYLDNMTYAIQEAKKRKGLTKQIIYRIAEVMGVSYIGFIMTSLQNPVYLDQNFKRAAKFYKEVFSDLEIDVEERELYSILTNVMDEYSTHLKGILPTLTFLQFLDAVRGESQEIT